MVIDKIGNIGKVFQNKKPQSPKAKAPANGPTSDSVSISQEALKAQDTAKVKSAVNESKDIRADRVKEVKAKLANGDYDKVDGEMLDRVADKIAEALIRG